MDVDTKVREREREKEKEREREREREWSPVNTWKQRANVYMYQFAAQIPGTRWKMCHGIMHEACLCSYPP